jgi:phage baseplate assembly protein V
MSFSLGASSRTGGVGDPETTELQRRLSNLVRHGKVSAVDFSGNGPRVRITIGDPTRPGHHLTTAWLRWSAGRAAAGVRTFSAPEVGEAVTLLAIGGDLRNAVVLPGGLNTNDAPAPGDRAGLHRTVYGDGTAIEYDAVAHRLVVSLGGGGEVMITCPGTVTLKAPTVRIEGNVEVVGGDVTADGVSLKQHLHTKVTPGTGLSGPPKPP